MLSKLGIAAMAQAVPNDGRQMCRYGAECFQRNPEHHQKFSHPPTKIAAAQEKTKDAVAGWATEVEAAWSKQLEGGGGSSNPSPAFTVGTPVDKRPDCRNGMGCHQKNPEHKVMFKHQPGWNPGEQEQNSSEPLSMYGYGSSSEYGNNTDLDYNTMLKQKVQDAVNAATNAVGGASFESSNTSPVKPAMDLPVDPNDRRPDCRNGAGCHQKNPEHKVMFRHPPGWVPGAGSEPAASWKKQVQVSGGGELVPVGGGSDRRPDCRNGAGCTQPNPEHKVMFRHPPGWDPANPVRDGVDRRGMCKWLGECTQKNPEHQVMFKHPPGWTPDGKKGWERGEYGPTSNNGNNNYDAQQYYQEQLRRYQERYPGHDPAKMIQYPGYSGYGNSNGSGSGNSMTYEQQWAQYQAQCYQWQQHQQQQQQQQGNATNYQLAKINPPLPPMPPKSDDQWKYENAGDKRAPCRNEGQCHQKNNEHKEMFRHPNGWNPSFNGSIPPPPESAPPARDPKDKRPPCRLGAECPVQDEDPEHKVMFWHPEPTGPGGKTISAAMEYYRKNAMFMPKEDEWSTPVNAGPYAQPVNGGPQPPMLQYNPGGSFPEPVNGGHYVEPAKYDRRPFCRYDRGCKHTNPEHQMMFQHPPGWVPPPPLPEAEPAPPGLEEEQKKAKENKRRIMIDEAEESRKKSKQDILSELD